MSGVVQKPALQQGNGLMSHFGASSAAFFVALPIILFYSILFGSVVNLPINDDYAAILGFMNRMQTLHGFSAKASWFLASQHNEYKLFFLHGVVWFQCALLGHVNFTVLSIFGNAFVALLAFLLWKMFLPAHPNIGRRLALFVPVTWLLFQLQYFETLNWAMAGLANLTVVFFSIAAIYFLSKPTVKAFCGAIASFVLAVGSLSSGFLLIPIGLLMLALNRQYSRIAVWLVVSFSCIAAYSYRYNVMSSQANTRGSVFAALRHFQPIYVVSFVGNSVSPFQGASLVLGTAICLFFAWMTYRGYVRRNPLVSYCVLFLLLTAVGVAGIRSGLGLDQSLCSRYTIYSALLLIFAWFAIVEEFVRHKSSPLLDSGIYLGVVAIAILFSLCTDKIGSMSIESRDRLLVQGMCAWEHSNSPESVEGPDILIPIENGRRAVFNRYARAVLKDSIRLGVYGSPSP